MNDMTEAAVRRHRQSRMAVEAAMLLKERFPEAEPIVFLNFPNASNTGTEIAVASTNDNHFWVMGQIKGFVDASPKPDGAERMN